MAKGKYKKRHKFVNINGNELYFLTDKRMNEDCINEIRKYDENGKVENEYKRLVDEINFKKYDFFGNYVNTIANHIIGRIYTSYLNFKLEKVKELTLKTKKQLLDEIGFNGNKTIIAIGTAISSYLSPNNIRFLRNVNNRIDDVFQNEISDHGFGLRWSIEEVVRLSFNQFYRVSHRTISVKETSPKKADVQDAIVAKDEPKNISDDLIFLKKKAILLNDAKTIEEVVNTANQILKLAEVLKGV